MAEQQVIVRLVSEVDAYAIGDEALELPAKLTRYGLSELVNHLLGSNGKPTPFDFLLEGELLRSSLAKFMQARGISGEATLELRYFPLVREPEKISQNAHDEWVSAIDSRRSDGLVLTGSYDGLARLYAAPAAGKAGAGALRLLCAVEARGSPLKCAVLVEGAAAGEKALALLATGALDGSMRVWRAHADGTAACVAICAGPEGSVDALAASADGADGVRLASGSRDGLVSVWDPRAAIAAAPAEGAEAGGKVEKKRRKTERAAAGAADAAAAAASTPTLAPAIVLRGHSQPVTGVAWAGGGAASLVSASWDGGVRVWDVSTGKCAHTVGGLKAVQSLALSSGARSTASGPLLAATGHDNGLVQLWDARAKPGEAAAAKLLSHARWVSALAFSDSSEHLLLSASHDASIKMWDVRGKLPLHTLAAHADKVLCVGWGGLEGNTILSGGADAQLLAHALPTSK